MGPGRLIRVVCTMRRPAVLIGSVVAVCVGLEILRRGASVGRTVRIPKRAAVRQDYFRIRRVIGGSGKGSWLLLGFGRYECALSFQSWEEAMNQARYRIETLSTGEAELRTAMNLL